MASPGDEQEFVRRLEEQLRQLSVGDVLAQTVVTVSQLAWQRLAPEARDLDQARLAIDALRALVPVLKGTIPGELARDFGQVVANLQLAYASAAAEPAPSPAAAPAGDPTAAGGADASGVEARTDEALPGDEPPAEPISES